jgi:hypothetical protein
MTPIDPKEHLTKFMMRYITGPRIIMVLLVAFPAVIYNRITTTERVVEGICLIKTGSVTIVTTGKETIEANCKLSVYDSLDIAEKYEFTIRSQAFYSMDQIISAKHIVSPGKPRMKDILKRLHESNKRLHESKRERENRVRENRDREGLQEMIKREMKREMKDQ